MKAAAAAAIFVSCFVAASLGVPASHHVVHERRDVGAVSGRVVKRAAASADALVPVRIALKQRNLDKGMEYLMDVSDPSSKNYGNHYTQDQVVDLFSPAQDSAEIVKRWLVERGVPDNRITSPRSKGWLDFKTTVSQLEDMLKTTYHFYENKKTGSQHLGADSYSLPSEVSRHVDFVTPGVVPVKVRSPRAMPGHPRKIPFAPYPPGFTVQSQDATDCPTHVTPACIKALYNVTDATTAAEGNQLGMFESDDEMHKQADLDKFYGLYASKVPKGTGPKIDLIDWGERKPDPSQAQGEAALDFDVSIPVIYPQGTELYQTKSNYDGQSHLGFLNQFLDAVDGAYCTSDGGDDPDVDGATPDEACGTFKPANVISLSYGLTENNWPTKYLKRQCDEFMKLGLQGSSIVFASGDGGVAGGHGGECLGNKSDIFNPASPASCPYVTSVGATLLPPGSAPGDAESATERFGSGGGFSNIWTAPDYQKTAVSAFFSSHDPGFPAYNTSDNKIPSAGGGVYNRAGRGFPDVSAVGDYGVIVLNGRPGRTGGTSMSAPIVAAILTRVNEVRLAAGKKPVGFANPALYRNPAMFKDVTRGGQSGDAACNGKGFSTVEGWDPVTGLGTPDFPAWIEYFSGL
ncbi:Peptidase S8/S53, subtilisin/kexin/sedolisin [Metarhizium album ARSEF 1941]|uniref:tripeptidyl-peptidase II n=1 Tax=Metarhizium album (strain ARSEF 1941) TaxID=1081103 RepID=A0A0B2WXT1_METAS|nr:Peptidase S8/S53, subtilisin/kexin/sedolisin [Metarhizium album ARSEF 1941]KHN98389.1 Peptidase S8/S53, subtilisin/kexin/sedolisin [Metarhizium album ARSEF 1941]